jgi:hypothetical protein
MTAIIAGFLAYSLVRVDRGAAESLPIEDAG